MNNNNKALKLLIANILNLCIVLNLYGQQCISPSPQWIWKSQTLRIASQSSTHCTNRAVFIVPPSGLTNVRYIYDFKTPADTLNATTVSSNVYTEEGFYRIIVIGKNGNNTVWDCGIISVKPTPKPNFTVSGDCTGTSVKLAVNSNGLIYGSYTVDWGDGSLPFSFSPNQQPTYTYSTIGEFPIKVTGEGTLDYAGCSAQSNPQTFRANPTPLEITNAFATVDENLRGSVTLMLPTSVKVKNYIFTHNSVLTESQANTYIDPLNNVSEQSICYNVSYIDNCDKSPSAAPSVCTIHLKRHDDLTLSWSSASPFIQPVENYTVEVLDSTGKILRTINAGLNTTISLDPDDDPNVSYRIKAINGSQSSFSNTVRVTRSAKLMIPDAFSPNNDQINDTFELRGNYIKQASVKVFDRWGNILFYTDNWKNSWNGTNINGQPMHNGIYTYRIEAIDFNNLTHLKWGMVYLLR